MHYCLQDSIVKSTDPSVKKYDSLALVLYLLSLLASPNNYAL